MDRVWTILIWIILISALLGVLRYYKGANTLLSTGLGFVFGESQLLSGLQPTGNGNFGGVASYPSYAA